MHVYHHHQVVNGCLLPCVASLLFLCINDARLMGSALQSLCANVRALPCVGIVCFMAFTVRFTRARTRCAAI